MAIHKPLYTYMCARIHMHTKSEIYMYVCICTYVCITICCSLGEIGKSGLYIFVNAILINRAEQKKHLHRKSKLYTLEEKCRANYIFLIFI